jgi:hypothetical protein
VRAFWKTTSGAYSTAAWGCLRCANHGSRMHRSQTRASQRARRWSGGRDLCVTPADSWVVLQAN